MSGEDQLAAGFVVVFTALMLGGVLWLRRGKSPEEMRALSQRILQHRYPYALLGSGAVMALLGVGMFVHARLIEVHTIDLAALEAGGELDASFVEVEGITQPAGRFCRSARRGHEQCYTPIVAGPQSTRVAVLISGDAPAGRGRFAGFVSRANQLTFRREVEQNGLRTASDLVRVIPESRAERANAGAWVSLGGLALVCVGWAWLRRARRRLA